MSCLFDGEEYSDGALICSNGRELKCSGNSWQETGYTCQLTTENDPKRYKVIDENEA